jgi:hypothetical protein
MAEPKNPKSRSRFEAYSLEELAALPAPKLLIPGALRGGDLVVVHGDSRFAPALADILGVHAVLIWIDQTDHLPTVAAKVDRLREANPEGVILLGFRDGILGSGFRYWAGAADAIFEAETNASAIVRKLRDFPDERKALTIRDGVARVVRA